MPAAGKIAQPRHYDAFHCIGADCEDTCCAGWGVLIDRVTYEKYRQCGDPELRPSFDELITINTVDQSDEDHAVITLSETHCPFLSERLCSIQKKLGEEYLSDTCAIYPRILNRVGDTLERTLDLSCPEAARVVLSDPHPAELVEIANDGNNFRLGHPHMPDTPNPAYQGGTYPCFLEVRSLVVTILRERTYPLWKRLVIIGHLCDKLNEMARLHDDQGVPNLIQAYLHGIKNQWFDDLLNKCQFRPATQLITILELIVRRITSDFTGRRFLDCYQDFMHGLEWTEKSALEDIARRYAEAYSQYYLPFIQQNEHVLEHYLATYVYKNLFPLGRLESNRKCGIHHIENSISIQCMLMMAYYAILRTVAIGMAGLHKSAFAMDRLVKVIQSTTKEFEHSTSFPAHAIEILMRNGLNYGASMAVLVQDM